MRFEDRSNAIASMLDNMGRLSLQATANMQIAHLRISCECGARFEPLGQRPSSRCLHCWTRQSPRCVCRRRLMHLSSLLPTDKRVLAKLAAGSDGVHPLIAHDADMSLTLWREGLFKVPWW